VTNGCDLSLSWNCISQFRVLAFRHSWWWSVSTLQLLVSEPPVCSLWHFVTLGFAISRLLRWRVFTLDSSNSRYPKLRYGFFFISRLRVSKFWDSSDEESLLLTPPTPDIQNSGIESLSFLDFGFRDFGTPYDESLCHFHLSVSEISVSNTSKWSRNDSPWSPRTNGSDHFSISYFMISGLLLMRVFDISISR
jgi:hypothetical protein